MTTPDGDILLLCIGGTEEHGAEETICLTVLRGSRHPDAIAILSRQPWRARCYSGHPIYPRIGLWSLAWELGSRSPIIMAKSEQSTLGGPSIEIEQDRAVCC
ncbi:uncharacterized protein SCHCODRAFT_02081837 [Schizophyllum commune H4-8]|uniref:uncharacterized protein n=1 Tax=Schizophyllum commune (strain H4-8 / FGSC 9210) TaxID=578458 RepID=UPI0021606989|nr:uncharacterized protein SCHCODRAFT_02081837 [Schizophyllum commune H4-8]KAI5886817.1 hypothetical protein SCHCODRAFT_02081837 [Schizophyllum commune H4-8]